MSTDALRWLTDQLALPRIDVVADGTATPNATAQTLGARAGRDLRTIVRAIVGRRTPSEDLDHLLATLAAGGSSRLDIEPGRPGTARWSVVGIGHDDGQATIVCVPRELGVATELVRRAAAAEQAATVSHEIANALTSIIGWVDVARGSPERAAEEDALGLIEASARAGRAAAESLLAVTRERSEPEVIDVGALAGSVARLMAKSAQARECTVDTKVGADLWVRGRPGDVWTLVWNLVQNAVEAVPAGGHVSIDAVGSGAHVRIIVADDGPGLAPEARAHAFEPFFTTKARGTGLGLSLVQRAAEALGGTVKLDQARATGARFVVDLPRVLAKTPAPEAPRRSSGVRSTIAGMRVLVVEDDGPLRAMLRTALELRGAEVTAVESGEEARAQAGTWDVAVIDCQLGESRGEDVLAALRAARRVRAAVLMTGAEGPRQSGSDARQEWLRKPFEVDRLVDVLARVAEPTLGRFATKP